MQYYNFGASSTEFLLLVGHWNCNGGTFDFIDVCTSIPAGATQLGVTSVCSGKCHFNASSSSIGNC